MTCGPGRDALHSRDLPWHHTPQSSEGHPLPSPKVAWSQGQQHRNSTHIFCFNKTRKGKKTKGLDQDPAVDLSYHGKDRPGHSICCPTSQRAQGWPLPTRFYCW